MKNKDLILNFNKNWLIKNNSINTITEICQQPEIWILISEMIKRDYLKINNFVSKFIRKDTTIVMTGSGSAEFVGNCLYQKYIKRGFKIISVGATEIITAPFNYFSKNDKILLVSFTRSGDSPESVEAYRMINDNFKNVKNIIITCNRNGKLISNMNFDENNLLFLLPKDSYDKGFSMTSSFTGMLIAFQLILEIKEIDSNLTKVKILSESVTKNINNFHPKIQNIAEKHHSRVVFLGSNELKGFAQDSRLKLIELTGGEINTYFDSPLGFRHGSKTLLNINTLVILMMSADKHKRKYETDFVGELYEQKQIDRLVILDNKIDFKITNHCHDYLNFDIQGCEIFTGLNYIIFSQIYAFYKSLFLNKSPDNPSPSGLINRVVQGVTIYKCDKK